MLRRISVRRGCVADDAEQETVYHWQSRGDDREIQPRVSVGKYGTRYATVARAIHYSVAPGVAYLLTTRKPTGFIVRKA